MTHGILCWALWQLESKIRWSKMKQVQQERLRSAFGYFEKASWSSGMWILGRQDVNTEEAPPSGWILFDSLCRSNGSQSIETFNTLILTQRRNRTSKMISRILVCFPFCPGFLHAHYLLCLGQVVPDDSGVSRPGCHSNFIDLQRDSYSDETCFPKKWQPLRNPRIRILLV